MDTPFKQALISAANAIDAAAALALSNAQRALSDAERHAAFAKGVAGKIKAAQEAEEMPSAVLDMSASDECTCDICGSIPEWVEMDKEYGICHNCADHMDDGLKYYTEEFAEASAHGKDALHLLVLRQRADNCRDFIAAAAASYDGDLEMHEASVEEEMLNRRATECLGRLPASFAPWWKDTWTHEKWCEMGQARDVAGWPVEKGAPIVQRLAAMFLAEQHKAHELKKAHAEELQAVEKRLNGEMELVMKHKLKEMEAKHAEVLANIQRARKEDLEAVEARHKREMAAQGAKYTEALDPLLGIRDRVRTECEKKCEDANRKGYAAGYAFADQKWNPVYKAVCEELAAAQKELSGWAERCVAAQNEAEALRKELKTEVDGATRVFDAMESDLEGIRAENNALLKENELLLELVGHTQKLMTSNPELFGGEARGTSSPRPPTIIRLPPIKEEDNERALNLLKGLLAPSQLCGVVESAPTVLPGIVEAVPSAEQLCMALTRAQAEEMDKAEAVPPLPPSPPPSPILVPDQPTECGAAGCIDCAPEKPKPDYKNPRWPSPITKRFAKHIAKQTGKVDPKTIKTHEGALEFLAKWPKISVEDLLKMEMRDYQKAYAPWSLDGPCAFLLGSASRSVSTSWWSVSR